MDGLVYALMLAPLAGGVGMLVARGRLSTGRVCRTMLVVTALTAAGLAALLPFAGQPLTTVVTWLPGSGPMALSLDQSGLLAAVMTTVAAAAALFMAMITACDDVERPWLMGAIVLCALSFANLAFLAGHFLARYVALEVVGLCIALAALIEMRGREGMQRAIFVYLLMRLADAGLLTAILLLKNASGTLEIGPALAAGQALDGVTHAWVVAGLLLAVIVKIGLWPFHVWVQVGRELARLTDTWLYATLMPNLGLYLLYRVTPLLALHSPLRIAVMILGVGSMIASVLLLLQQPVAKTTPVYAMAALGGLVVCLAAGVGRAAWWALMAFTPLRLLLWYAPRLAEGLGVPSPPRIIPRAWETGADNPTMAIGKLAQQMYSIVESGLLERGLGQIVSRLVAGATAIYNAVELGALERGLRQVVTKVLAGATAVYDTVELGMLERIIDQLAGSLTGSASQLYHSAERKGLDGLLVAIADASLKSGHHLRRWHVGRLRTNLLWVVLALILAIVVFVV
ncbi:MAG TPA: hypothetical protein ENN99_08570 [Chloroflexi bacterium]|nr:hypothetical protein [Chloroflexota bacterium]